MSDVLSLSLSRNSVSIGLIAVAVALLSLVVWLMLDSFRRDRRAPTLDTLLTALGVVLAPVWLWLLGAVVWSLWQRFTGPDPAGALGPAPAGALGLGTGALIAALLGAPFVIWATVLKHQGLRTQREGQITDRISKAVEQLGAEKSVKRPYRKVSWTAGGETHTWFEGRTRRFAPPEGATDIVKKDWEHLDRTVPNIEVRVGALLSLERIAQDSTRHDRGRDHVRVMEILCAYIRENAPAGAASVSPFATGTSGADLITKSATDPWGWLHALPKPRTDIQLALSIIGRRSAEQRAIEAAHVDTKGSGYRLDLSETDLRRADLDGLNFANAVFFRCMLEGCNCAGTDFSGANMFYAALTAAQAARADFRNAKLEATDFSHARLEKADLRDATMSHTRFVRTDLRAARLRLASPDHKIHLNRAFIIFCDLTSVLLEGDLLSVNFGFRDYDGKSDPATLSGASFRNARIGATRRMLGRDVTESALEPGRLSNTFGDASVTLAPGTPRPGHWPDWALPDTGPQSFDAEYRRWLADPPAYVPPPRPGQRRAAGA